MFELLGCYFLVISLYNTSSMHLSLKIIIFLILSSLAILSQFFSVVESMIDQGFSDDIVIVHLCTMIYLYDIKFDTGHIEK